MSQHNMFYNNPNECMGNRSSWEKFRIAWGILANPWMLLLDKLGIVKHPTYFSRTGLAFETRGQTTDINDAVVVLSGKEYPAELVGLDNLQFSDTKPMVLDCGGHIGTFSLYIKSHWPNTQILAVEPVPANQQLFHKNIQLNNLQGITLLPLAISGRPGEFYMDLSDKQFDAVNITSQKPVHNNFITIQAISLKQLLEQQGITKVDLMKLDVEGAEYDIIPNSISELKSSVQRLIMEFHPAGDKNKRDQLIAWMCDEAEFELIFESKNILGFENPNLTRV